MLRSALVLALLAALAAPLRADEAQMRVPVSLAARVLTGEHSGLTIDIEPDPAGPLVTVSTQMRPLGTGPGYPLAAPDGCGDPQALDVAPGFVVPGRLAAAAGSATSAVEVMIGVVAFASREIALDEGDRGPQDGVSVLRRRRGRCSGRANVAVGLLRAVGIPARVVHGVVFDGDRPRWHRWGEAWLGELGWLPFDPGASAGVVSVRHLPCRAVVPGLQPQGVKLMHIEEACFRALPLRGQLKVALSVGVTLRCASPSGAGAVTAVLHGPDGMRWVRRGEGGVTFAELVPARYWLTWHAGGATVSRMPLDLTRSGDVNLTLIADRRPSS